MQNKPELSESLGLRGKLAATDWLSDIEYVGGTEIVQVVFKNTRSAFYLNPDRLNLKIGDWVAVEAAPGTDIGKVCMVGPLVKLQMKKSNAGNTGELKRVIRQATDSDMERFRAAREREEETMIRSRQIAAELELNMKIGDVEYQGDGAKAIFYYIADERVDFRKLIRILADTFKVRIEMKQIGARQEAGRIGGIGPCGRPLCCSSWMSKFVSVGTGAARIQDLSMNPQKLAGQCGKLKCCINFETDAYAEATRQLPPRDAVLYTREQEFYQFKVDILSRKITYSTDKHLAANLVTIDASRAFDIIALNKQGVKVESLMLESEMIPEQKEFVDLVGQDSLTRFDKSRKKRKKRGTESKKKNNEGRDDNNATGRNNRDDNPSAGTKSNNDHDGNDERRETRADNNPSERRDRQRYHNNRPNRRHNNAPRHNGNSSYPNNQKK